MKLKTYPNLDPELFDIVAAIDEDFSTPPHLLAAVDFRTIMDGLAARSELKRPTGVKVSERDIAGAGVKVREYSRANSPSRAVLMYMHGGGWTVGGLDSHDGVCADICAQTGMSVVSVEYSLAPEHRYPVALNECLAVYSDIRRGLGNRYPGQDRIIVGGDSAGANLATALCLKHRDGGKEQPAGQVLIYPCVAVDFDLPSYTSQANAPFLYRDLMEVFWKNYLGPALVGDHYACPAQAADLSALAPAVVMTAALDPLVDEGDRYAASLTRAGVPVFHRRAEHLIHGYLRFRTVSGMARDEFDYLVRALRVLAGD